MFKNRLKQIKKLIKYLYYADTAIKYEINYNFFEKKALTSKEIGIEKNSIRDPKINSFINNI